MKTFCTSQHQPGAGQTKGLYLLESVEGFFCFGFGFFLVVLFWFFFWTWLCPSHVARRHKLHLPSCLTSCQQSSILSGITQPRDIWAPLIYSYTDHWRQPRASCLTFSCSSRRPKSPKGSMPHLPALFGQVRCSGVPQAAPALCVWGLWWES